MAKKPIPEHLLKETAGSFYLHEPDDSRKAYAAVPLSYSSDRSGNRVGGCHGPGDRVADGTAPSG